MYQHSKNTQSKANSALESATGVVVGYFVAVVSQMLIFPVFDLHVSTAENFVIGAYFSVVSFIRSYLLRRWFNNRQAGLGVKQQVK